MQIIFSPAEEILSTTGHSSPVLSGADQEYCDILSPSGVIRVCFSLFLLTYACHPVVVAEMEGRGVELKQQLTRLETE